MPLQIGDSLTPQMAMELAIDVAKGGYGHVSPNPLVGCVIVDTDHRFLGSGAHLKWGEAHAEVNALNSIENMEQLSGATAYVTLEPCAHTGKTGSCAKTLAAHPFKKVVYGARDPNPLVAGRGVAILEEAGIDVEFATTHSDACKKLADQFLYHVVHKRPFVAIKAGASLDGKIALGSGESQWITSPEARKLARNIRARYDATLIGAGTFIKDNPSLDFRETGFAATKSNKIIIVDPKGKGAAHFDGSQLSQKHPLDSIFVLCPKEVARSWQDRGVNAIHWEPTIQGWLKALTELYKREVYSIYAEGGSFIFGQLLEHQLFQKLYLFQAPKIIGQGKGWSELFQIENLKQAIELKKAQYDRVGADLLLTAYSKTGLIGDS